MFLTELLERQKENEKIAIKFGENEITYKQFYSDSRKLSNALNDNIAESSLNIAIFLPNSINYALAYFSILFSNKIIVPIGTPSKKLEIISTLEYCEIDVIITSLQYRSFLKECLSLYGYRTMLLFVEDQSIVILNNEKDFIRKSNAIHNIGHEDDVAILLHTSGTTSNPKRVMLSHGNLINNVESNIQSLNLTSNDKVLISMPMYFGYCNTAQFLTHIYLGASMVILNGLFLPKLFSQTVQNEKITNFTSVPSMLLMLLEYRYTYMYDFSSLRYICFGGGKMPVESLQKLIQILKSTSFIQTYGQTEASPRITALLPKDALRKIGSVGQPIPNVKIKIVNELGNALKGGEIGEIVIQGKNVMKGYYKREEITKKTIIDGWLHTNDLGYLDDEGYLYLTGRKTNMIISGGINIYPEEIEEVLMSHPNIQEACVVSEEHTLLGEVPKAKIVVKDISAIDNYRAFCADKLADYKVPVKFEIVDRLDKTYNGKIKRI
mgnify:CR=1 FL=1